MAGMSRSEFRSCAAVYLSVMQGVRCTLSLWRQGSCPRQCKTLASEKTDRNCLNGQGSRIANPGGVEDYWLSAH